MQALPAIATTALSAGSSVMAGRAQARSYAAEAQQYEAQAKGVDLQAKQSSERRREDFNAQVASVLANFAQRGRSDDTPTAIAIDRELRRQAVRDEGVERVGFKNQAAAYRMGAASRRRAASNANIMGYIGAAQTIMSNGSEIHQAMKRDPKAAVK